MHAVKVSCIVPCFNSKKYIRDAINSILVQTYNNIEIIAIDDGSSDGTINILNEYVPRITILSHRDQKNHGKPKSLNLGIRNSTGELIAFIDHDDIWFPEKIESQVNMLQGNEMLGLIYTNGIYLNGDGEDRGTILPRTFQENNSPASLLLDCYITSASAVMVRRSVFDTVGFFDEELVGCDDHDMWLRIIERYKIGFIKEPLYGYRIHSNQLSNDIKMWLGGFRILENAGKRYGYHSNIVRKRKAVLFYRLSMFASQNRYHFDCIRYYLLAGLLDPIRALRVVLGIERKM